MASKANRAAAGVSNDGGTFHVHVMNVASLLIEHEGNFGKGRRKTLRHVGSVLIRAVIECELASPMVFYIEVCGPKPHSPQGC